MSKQWLAFWGLFPNDLQPLTLREQEFFLKASTWPDIVRDEAFPQRRKNYHSNRTNRYTKS